VLQWIRSPAPCAHARIIAQSTRPSANPINYHCTPRNGASHPKSAGVRAGSYGERVSCFFSSQVS
jgi:hypothetical protein